MASNRFGFRPGWIPLFAMFAITGAAQAQAPGPASWEHIGSDIPADPAWRTGVLANGLRYAVRRNALPPGTISIRVRIAVGGLYERDDEQGWTHLIEHMVFRGTSNHADGDAVKTWQRLGANFGSDSNAFTSLLSTSFVLDLPKADPASYREALGVLADMVQHATFDPKLLETERQVVIAEGAIRLPALNRQIQQNSRDLLQTGLLAARRDILGTTATLAAADTDRLRAFYRTWYRPERTSIVVVGDADPALLEQVVRESFGPWQAAGAKPAEPDFGSMTPPASPVVTLVNPAFPNQTELVWVSPHDASPATITGQQKKFVDLIAVATLGQRLRNEAEKSEAIVNATIGKSDSAHMADQLVVTVTPRPGDWKAAIDQVFAVLNGAIASPPSRAEIDQQIALVRENLARSVERRETATSPALANIFIHDVDQGDVTPTRKFYLDLFDAMRPSLTPDLVGKAIREALAPDPRMLVLSPTPIEGGHDGAVAVLADARKMSAAGHADLRKVSLDELKLPGPPGRIVSTTSIPDLGIETIGFANGAVLVLKKTPFEKDTIRIQIKVGHGLLSQEPGHPGLFWSSGALLASGLGPFTSDELNRLLSGRQLWFAAQPALDGLAFGASTNGRDLPDLMKIMSGALTQMRFTPAPVDRLRSQFAATYQTSFGAPDSVLKIFGAPYFYNGDTRFRGSPSPEDMAALSLPAFRDFWAKQLAEGPVRVIVVGDFDRTALIAAVNRTIGALPLRIDSPPSAQQTGVRPPQPSHDPFILRHRGDRQQAIVVRTWPAFGALDDIDRSRALSLAAAVIGSRLNEEFREKSAGSYAPFASLNQHDPLPGYGVLAVGAQLKADRIDDFEAGLDRIVADLARNGPSPDALQRAKAIRDSSVERAQTDNGYWMTVLDRDLGDPRVLHALRTFIGGVANIDAAAVRDVVARTLKPDGWSEIRILPPPLIATLPSIASRLAAPPAPVRRNGQQLSLAAIDPAITGQRPSASTHVAQAKLYRAAGDNDRALTEAAEAIRLNPAAIDAFALRADILFGRGRIEDAAGEARAAIRANPALPSAFVLAGAILCSTGHQAEGMQAFDRAIAIRPEASAFLARSRFRPVADMAGRRADVEAALKLDPKAVDILLALAALQQRQHDFKGSIATLTSAVTLAPDDRNLAIELASAYARDGQADLARKGFAAVRVRADRDVSALNQLCWVSAIAGFGLETALADCKAAAALDGKRADVLDSLGFVLLRLKRYDEAITAYDAALRITPNLPASLYGRGLAHLGKEEVSPAEADLKLARSLSPNIDAEYDGYGMRAKTGR